MNAILAAIAEANAEPASFYGSVEEMPTNHRVKYYLSAVVSINFTVLLMLGLGEIKLSRHILRSTRTLALFGDEQLPNLMRQIQVGRVCLDIIEKKTISKGQEEFLGSEKIVNSTFLPYQLPIILAFLTVGYTKEAKERLEVIEKNCVEQEGAILLQSEVLRLKSILYEERGTENWRNLLVEAIGSAKGINFRASALLSAIELAQYDAAQDANHDGNGIAILRGLVDDWRPHYESRQERLLASASISSSSSSRDRGHIRHMLYYDDISVKDLQSEVWIKAVSVLQDHVQ